MTSSIFAGSRSKLLLVVHFVLVVVLGNGVAGAQEQRNFLAIDGQILDGAGPYYFMEQGDPNTAYAKAAPLAEALGWDVTFDNPNKSLRFTTGRTTLSWKATSDLAHGLEPRLGTLHLNGVAYGGPTRHVLLVDGTSFVPIEPLSKAVGRTFGWHASARVITLDRPTLSTSSDAPVVSPQAEVSRPALSAQRKVVVIDAGHGGHDPGTNSSWAVEKTIVLQVASRLQRQLEAEGVEVIMTRDHDTFLTLQERAAFSTTDRNAFISIHANAAGSQSANGVETWVFGQPLDPSLITRAVEENGGGAQGQALTDEAAASLDIAGDILRETQLNYSLALANSVQSNLVARTGARDRGVRQNLFYVIKNARIPAILVELGFVSNPQEGRRLTHADYQDALAQALADGIIDFLGGDDTHLAQR